MIDDLLRQHALVGLTRAQAVELLGKPPETSYFREYGLVYFLGAEGGVAGVDSRWLLLRVDSTGHVTERRLATD